MAITFPVSLSLWEVFEITLPGPDRGNPFVDVQLSARFQNGNRWVEPRGFYDGEGTYRIRFLADRVGRWRFQTASNQPELDGKTGEFEVGPAAPGRHGPVRVNRGFHFAHEDGTRFIPVGTTCYAWTHQTPQLEARTLETLKTSPFNKIRMCVFPKDYDWNRDEPPRLPFVRRPSGEWDWQKPEPEFFQHLEARVGDLNHQGVECDLILFHPYDRWGLSTLPAEGDDFYLSYLTSRLAAFPNVWWSLCNEFDLMAAKKDSDWDRMAKVIQEGDPWDHLRSIHNCVRNFDHSRGWVTHASLQRVDVYKTTENTTAWREAWRKPVVVDEFGYEGDINWGWGNLTAEEVTRRFWEATVRGGYATHGETYLNEAEELWWSKGGQLVGQSPARIAFLRAIVEGCPDPGVEPLSLGFSYWDLPVGGVPGEYYLFYFGFSRPRFRDVDLPDNVAFHVDLIDTWNMTVTPLEGLRSGRFRISLPGRQYMALRAVRA